MNRVVHNVIANAVGGIWVIILNLISIPIQIRILGAEAYGLIGFISTMQIILVIFDLGFPATIVREIALDQDTSRQFSRILVQSCSTIYWVIALLIGGTFVAVAEWIASQWLNVENIPTMLVVQALRLLALYIIFTWPINIYVSTLAGLQRFDVINLLKILNSTAAQVGGIIVLLVTRDLSWFVLWLAINAFIFFLVYVWMCFRLLPGLSLIPKVSIQTMKRIWKFSLDLNLISTLAVVYVQTDRILISALLPLRMLGYYSVAYGISRQIGTIQEFINTAFMPALSAKAGTEKVELLRDLVLRYAQVSVYIVSIPAFILIFFGYQILKVWAGHEVAQNGAAALSLLGVGFLLNASMTTSYTLAVATGHSRIPLIINIAGLGIYLPTMVFLLANYGLEGAALGWVLLNVYYLLTLMPTTQRRILRSDILSWLTRVLLPFVFLGVFIFTVGHTLLQFSSGHGLWLFVCLLCTVAYSVMSFFFLAPPIRQQIIAIPRQIVGRRTI